MGEREQWPLIGSIDAGTQSCRFIVYDPADLTVPKAYVTTDPRTSCRTSSHILTPSRHPRPPNDRHHATPLRQSYPRPGWVEQDPEEIWSCVVSSVEGCMRTLDATSLDREMVLGIANQRETSVLWDRETGKPLCNAIVWNDDRTADLCARLASGLDGGVDAFRGTTGLPISTYFSAYKILWMMENCPAVADAVASKRCMFGTVDCWLVYKLTGHRRHCVDVTNASRTGLMDLKTLSWDEVIIKTLGLEHVILPEIVSSAECVGDVDASSVGCLGGARITGCVGDQQASMLGHQLHPSHVKNTYGTGCFVLMNTGHDIVCSRHGLISTVAFKLGRDAPAMYALEGAIGTAGQGISWLRDSLLAIESSEDSERVAALTDDCQGVVFVPAFSGLLAPFWCPGARAAILGMTYATEQRHIVRAMLAAICFQTKAVLDAMASDCGTPIDRIDRIVVDGGASSNNLLMQMQADVLGKTIRRARSAETTALGAAVAAGVGAGLWTAEGALEVLSERTKDAERTFTPRPGTNAAREYITWLEAVASISKFGVNN